MSARRASLVAMPGRATHRVRFDESAETCVAVCTCGRRALALDKLGAARVLRAHLVQAAATHEAERSSRILRLVRPA